MQGYNVTQKAILDNSTNTTVIKINIDIMSHCYKYFQVSEMCTLKICISKEAVQLLTKHSVDKVGRKSAISRWQVLVSLVA